MSTFTISHTKQISKNKFEITISDDCHYHSLDSFTKQKVIYTRARLMEVITMADHIKSLGRFLIIEKKSDEFPHRLILRRATGGASPRTKEVFYKCCGSQ